MKPINLINVTFCLNGNGHKHITGIRHPETETNQTIYRKT